MQIRYGGPSVRWGRACAIESWAYLLKWALPVLLLLPGGILWLRARVKLSRPRQLAADLWLRQ